MLSDLEISAVHGVVHFSTPLWNTLAPSGDDVNDIESLVPVKILAHEVVERIRPKDNTVNNFFLIDFNVNSDEQIFLSISFSLFYRGANLQKNNIKEKENERMA
ncbi:hypothetical protein [Chryseobacterium sp. OSA05B]|uniref:hypothetical protein n=1 Tax=Chryseobacterium sp. OSA05B TaxID=2862650 RepID=UPI001CBD11CB|nr:hypothetical protein [Chryseobacterium sp. OSA05B]